MSALSMTARHALRGPQRLLCYKQRLFHSVALRTEPILIKPRAPLFFTAPPSTLRAHARSPTGDYWSRLFTSEAEFHSVADESLDEIQDVMEELFEELRSENDNDDLEVSVASGVLTLFLPPHGTWVINKQTPNRQLWWSSPLSGPRRYEYADGEWVFTRSMDSGDGEQPSTLAGALAHEIKELYGVDVEIDI